MLITSASKLYLITVLTVQVLVQSSKQNTKNPVEHNMLKLNGAYFNWQHTGSFATALTSTERRLNCSPAQHVDADNEECANAFLPRAPSRRRSEGLRQDRRHEAEHAARRRQGDTEENGQTSWQTEAGE